MKFSHIIGSCDPKIVLATQERLTSTFTELAMSYNIRSVGSNLGGDVFLHQLVSTYKHICDARSLEFNNHCMLIDANSDLTDEEKWQTKQLTRASYGKKLLTTASTNGKEYSWAPQFVLSKSKIGLRLVVGHEGWHGIFMHPSRRGTRNKDLWNVAVDFKVNFIQIEDLRARGFYKPEEVFRKELGDFVSLNDYILYLINPFKPPPKLTNKNPIYLLQQAINGNTDSLTQPLYYAEPNLPKELKNPEAIYTHILQAIPVCNTCGKIGVWEKPKEFIDLEKNLEIENNNSCPECGEMYHFDPFGFGNLLDEHTDCIIKQQELNQRIADAAEMARRTGGIFNAAIEDELAQLSKPRLTWQDFTRLVKQNKIRESKTNNWAVPKRRPLCAGLYVPSKMDKYINFGILYDCSGSMTKKQIAYGISQVAALADRGEGWAAPFDTEPYYNSAVKLKNANTDQLRNAKFKGGGGTILSTSLNSYEQKLGKVDILIVISDFELADMQQVLGFTLSKNTDVIWLSINGNHEFKPSYGRKFDLYNE